MATTTNDIRYLARCNKCHKVIGDWALKVPEEKRLCWDCKDHKTNLQKGIKYV